MVKREKRLKKGIDSLEKQKEVHEQKLEKAINEGDEYLERYYTKEIAALESDKKYKLSKLHRKDKDYKGEDADETERGEK